ncbi:hypothetical protein LTR40_001824 [Exophiala xenobiotica]|nr:hypothetical protein LTR40_001824 [Exophiala xenobiotica]
MAPLNSAVMSQYSTSWTSQMRPSTILRKISASVPNIIGWFDMVTPTIEQVTDLKWVSRTSVTDAESLSKAFEAVSTDFGRIDNCVTAAGIVCDRPFLETPRDEGMRVLEVNVMGTYLSAQLAVKQMQKQKSGGSIVMIASIAARAAIPSQRLSVYGASKGAIRALCRQLAVELGPLGIRVNSISPGYIETEMTRGLAATNPELLSVFGSAAPLQRMGDRADLKTIAAYLLSDAAAYTTGSDVLVTGGLHAGRF